MYLCLDSERKGNGWKGQVSEFFMTFGRIDQSSIVNIKNTLKVWDVSTMALYMFHSSINLIEDAFRNQKVTVVHTYG